jgi:SanA protein
MRKPGAWAFGLGAAFVTLVVLPDMWVWHQGQRNQMESPHGIQPRLVIVPGASVYRDGRLSPILKERMDAALLALLAWPNANVLLSGTSIPGGYDEVAAMERYARNRRLDSTRILKDGQGHSTQETIARIRRIHPMGGSVVIISQSWHLPRCLWLGRAQNLKGLACDRPRPWKATGPRLREHFARAENFWRDLLN